MVVRAYDGFESVDGVRRQHGYLAVSVGDSVSVRPDTLVPGEPGNVHSNYVYADLVEDSARGSGRPNGKRRCPEGWTG